MLRRRAVAVALLALVTAVAGLAVPAGATAAAGSAPTPITVRARAVDADGNPLRGVRVRAISTEYDDYQFLGRTDREGRIVRTVGPRPLKPGTDFHIAFQDDNTARRAAGELMVPRAVETTLRRGDNRVGTVVLSPGARLSGRATTPSGQPVRNISVGLYKTGTPFFLGTAGTVSGDDGRYVLSGLSAGTWETYAEQRRDGGSTTLLVGEPGTATTWDLTDVVVPGEATLSARSQASGQVTLTYTAGSATHGVDAPAGEVSISTGGRPPEVATLVDGSAVVTLSGLPSGARTVTATYAGPDLVVGRVGVRAVVR